MSAKIKHGVPLRNFMEENSVEFVKLLFISDSHGQFKQITYSLENVTQQMLNNPIILRHLGYSIMLDQTSCFIDPFCSYPTASIICNTNKMDDSRGILCQAEKSIRASNSLLVGGKLVFEIGFSISERKTIEKQNMRTTDTHTPYAAFDQPQQDASCIQGDTCALWGDTLHDVKSEIVRESKNAGINITHHFCGNKQNHCVMCMEDIWPNLVDAADNIQKFKYIAWNIVASYGKRAIFANHPNTDGNFITLRISIIKTDDNKDKLANKKYFHNISNNMQWLLVATATPIVDACCASDTAYYRSDAFCNYDENLAEVSFFFPYNILNIYAVLTAIAATIV